jgi:hypothetical protein
VPRRPSAAAFRALAVALAAVAALAAGCTTAPPAPEGRFPADFALDVTVLRGRKAPERLTVEDLQAKYILLPDGSLHADESPFIDLSTRPGRARILYDEQVQAVWTLVRTLGFDDRSKANGPPNPDLLRVAATERMTILTVRADGATWTYVRRAVGAEPADPAAAKVVRTLAIMAWIPDLSPDSVVPVRYDYGDDPYEVYRQVRERRGTPKATQAGSP